MTERLPWFPCYPSKLLGALGPMTPDQGYLYVIICLRIYETGGPCKDAVEVLARRTRMNRRRTADALDFLFRDGKLVRQDDGIMNPFAAEIMAEAIALHERRVSAGQKSHSSPRRISERNQSRHPSPAVAGLEPGQTHLHLQLHKNLTGLEKEKPKAQSGLGPFYASFASPQMASWEMYERKTKKSSPRDRDGGWTFPSEWPPGERSHG